MADKNKPSLTALRELSACCKRGWLCLVFGELVRSYADPSTAVGWIGHVWRDLCYAEGWPHAVLVRRPGKVEIRIDAGPECNFAPAGVRELRKIAFAADLGEDEVVINPRQVRLTVAPEDEEATARAVIDLCKEHLQVPRSDSEEVF
jgi:hypothetical protein